MATSDAHLPLFAKLWQGGQENGLPVKLISSDEVRETEPNVRCLSGLSVSTTGITSYRAVAQKYLEIFQVQGGVAKLRNEVRRIVGAADAM